MNITLDQKRNLMKLADYLSSGKILAGFDMWNYCAQETGVAEKTNCGSVGCAIGHAPYAGIPIRKGQSWTLFSEEAFGYDSESLEWEFMFGSEWKNIDNTSIGAAMRIYWVLSGNGIDYRFDEIYKSFPIASLRSKSKERLAQAENEEFTKTSFPK